MSAFIVKDETINRIVTYLKYVDVAKENYRFIAFAGADIANRSDFRALGLALLRMNAEAYKQRYDEDVDVDKLYVYADKSCTPMQAYKSLQCLLYQCSEGDVPETKLFNAMQEILHLIAESIIFKLPEYDRADWG